MAVAAFCVLSALGLIVAAQASCSLRTNQNSYSSRDQKTAIALSVSKISPSWAVINVATKKVELTGDLQPQLVVAGQSLAQYTADFTALMASGSYKLHVNGCTDSPTFTVQNPLFERQASNKTESPHGYSDNGISRGAGIALIVITVLLFVVMLALIGWVVFLYCC